MTPRSRVSNAKPASWQDGSIIIMPDLQDENPTHPTPEHPNKEALMSIDSSNNLSAESAAGLDAQTPPIHDALEVPSDLTLDSLQDWMLLELTQRAHSLHVRVNPDKSRHHLVFDLAKRYLELGTAITATAARRAVRQQPSWDGFLRRIGPPVYKGSARQAPAAPGAPRGASPVPHRAAAARRHVMPPPAISDAPKDATGMPLAAAGGRQPRFGCAGPAPARVGRAAGVVGDRDVRCRHVG